MQNLQIQVNTNLRRRAAGGKWQYLYLADKRSLGTM